MKEKVIIFIIGVLVGAVIASGAFLIYTKVSNNNTNNETQPTMNQNQNMNGDNMSTPPDKPEGTEGEEPPQKPEETTTSSN